MRLIAPSILAADFLRLGADIKSLNAAADVIHLDVMDGCLVPNISFGFSVVEAVAPLAQIPMDAHLMIVHPEKWFERFAKLGVSMLSFHAEAAEQEGKDAGELLDQVRALGMKAGLAINPDYPIEKVYPLLPKADFILVMSVFAGFGGQKFIGATFDRVTALRQEIARQGVECLIEVDGGVGTANIAALERAGADIFVAGSSVFKGGNPMEAIWNLREA